MTVWERFRLWRRSRPFWGGLLVIVAGIEIIGSMNLELGGGTISIGQEGFPAYLIAFTLIICGPLAWFTPAQRHFYGLIAVFVAIYSLLGVNLGGFFAGMLLGVAGGGLIFAWNPNPAPDSTASPDDDPDSAQDSSAASLDDSAQARDASDMPAAARDARDLPAAARDAWNTPAPGPGAPAPRSAAPGPRNGTADSSPRHAAMIVIALALSLAVVGTPSRADAAPCDPPAAAPSPSPSPSPTRPPGILDPLLDFLERLFGGGNKTPTPSPTPTPTAKPSPCPSPSGSVSPSPGTSGKPTTTKTPTAPSTPGNRITAESTFVSRRPGRMTGSSVTMTNLNFDGVVELPVKGAANMRVLKFSMAQSDTNDFKLQVFGDKGWDTELRSSKLTVNGGTVFFYTSRFRANLFGLIPVDYTPDSLPPPIPLPFVFFTNPDIQLVFVDSPSLLAPKLRINQIRAS